MLTYTQAAVDAILAGATYSERARITRGGDTLLDYDDVTLLDGTTVSLDENTASARTWSGRILDPTGQLAPKAAADALAPYGSELEYQIGVHIPGGIEWFPGGVYRLEGAKADYQRVINISNAPDRSSVVARARNESPYVIAGGNLRDAVVGYLHSKYPGLPIHLDPDAVNVSLPGGPRIFEEGSRGSSDPWADLRGLVAGFGRRLTMDATGTAVVDLVPDPRSQPIVWEYAPGEQNLGVSGEVDSDTTGLYNVWVVEGSGSGIDPPVRAVVEITDTADPLFPGPGGIGRRPTFYSSSFFTTVAQCVAAGEGFRSSQQGQSLALSFTAIANPLHEPTDLVRYASDELGVDFLLLLSRWTLPGNGRGTANYQTRRIQ